VSADISGLTPFTTYHYRLAASNAEDLGLFKYGHDATFTPIQGSAPSVGASSASGATPTAVSLNTQINPNLASTIYRFEYGIESNYGSQTLPSEPIGGDSTSHSVSTVVTGLQPGTTYHYRAVATNFNGVAVGSDQTFSTPAAPSVGAGPATDVTQTGATLGASIAPGFRATTYRFEYGRTTDYSASTSESSSIGSDNSFHPVKASVSGLQPATTYHYRVVATNAIGSTAGPDQEFSTAMAAAVVPTPTPPVPKFCKAGFVRKHGKCVKRRHHRQKRSTHRRNGGSNQ
jgi:phosphodiesterase/alkaline phosphatase D-like protein